MNQKLIIFSIRLWILIFFYSVFNYLFFSYSLAVDKLEQETVYTCKIINIFSHDTRAFTQGLAFENGFLYEGTGSFGKSSLRKIKLETGKTIITHKLPAHFFGEGITIYKDKIIQLTWKSNIGFVYDKDNFKILSEFNYPIQGWGITYDGKHLIMSDGTQTLYFLDPETFEEIRRIDVYDSLGPVGMLNELEYVRGKIYANIWNTNLIAIIEPSTGKVVGLLELEGLLSQEDRRLPHDVLNGIAYDPKGDRLFVTGKLWPKLFEIKLIPRD